MRTQTSTPGSPVRRALLIGINKYTPSPSAGGAALANRGRAPAEWIDLEGAVNDIEAMREVLISRFDFKDADVHVLVNADATRDHIVAAVRQWLIAPAAPGDVSFFFYAGHGSQVRNSKSAESDKMDETIVPADANRGQPDIRDKELARLFDEALDKHVQLTVAFDSCHSGSIARGLPRPTRYRVLPPDTRDVADASAPEPPEDRGALVLSGAQDDQLAGETKDEDHTPHGLFTWALLKTLRTMPIDETADRMFTRVRALMQSEDAAQEPVLAATPERRRAAVFGAAQRAGTGATIVAVQSVEADGAVLLQGGMAAGIRGGCELQAAGVPGDRAPMLRVTQARGLTHSLAIITKGSAHDVTPGALFEVVKWTAPAGAGLRVWIDPAPPASDIAAALHFGQGGNEAVEVLPSAKDADYVLNCRRQAPGVECAWVRPFTTEEMTGLALPANTNWIAVPAGDPAAAARQLEQLAGRLAVIRTWLQLESPPDVGQFPYRLALKNAATGETRTTGPLLEGEKYGLVMTLASPSGTLDRRYVYVFAINTKGRSTLLFPLMNAGNVENRLPARRDDDGRLPSEIALGAPDLLTVSGPFGVDTVVMLTTATALPDASILNGEAVLTRSMERGVDPLGRLLAAAAAGTRGPQPPTPTTWSIERLSVESRPAERR